MKRNKYGYTLVEMLVVLSIMALVMVGISFSTIKMQEYTFDVFVEEARESIEVAQQLATLRKDMYTVRKQTLDGVTYLVVIQGNIGVVKRTVLPKGVSVSLSTQENAIFFNQDMSPQKAATMTIEHSGINKKVLITVRVATGKVTVKEEGR